MRKTNVTEQILKVFDDVNWNPLTITMPQNGDVVTLTPEFYNTESQLKDMSTFKSLTVTGACMPISGTISHVVKQLRNYNQLIATRKRIDAACVPAQAAIPAPAFAYENA